MTKTVPLVVGIEPKERDAGGLLLRHGLKIAREINLPGVILGVAWFITAIFGGAFLLDHLMTSHGSSLAPFLPVLIGVWITTFFVVKMLLGYLLGFLFAPQWEGATSTQAGNVIITAAVDEPHFAAAEFTGVSCRVIYTADEPVIRVHMLHEGVKQTAGAMNFFLSKDQPLLRQLS